MCPVHTQIGGEGWGEVVRLIFKGVPISKQYLEILPILLNRTRLKDGSTSRASRGKIVREVKVTGMETEEKLWLEPFL